MVANPKATLFVLDRTNPYRSFEARCDVSMMDDPDADFMREIVTTSVRTSSRPFTRPRTTGSSWS
jgi:hypothetical protein